MDDLQSQITEEIGAITNFLELRLGYRSRWNGEVELSDDATTFGKALWNGRISINRQVAQTDLRWRTMIHEALHFFSVGLTPSRYADLEGWEEGVVEQLQRMLRPSALSALSVGIFETIFIKAEAHHIYNRYIQALEKLRVAVGETSFAFYPDLLSIDLQARPSYIIQLGRQLPTNQFRGFQREFASTFSVLRGD